MAATSVILDIRANTTRALGEFKKFSAQLDNKFLISGLKLDVVRSALGQINREFQRAMGEQGLASGQSLRAAQNQAALITNTFKGIGIDASIAITEQFSEAFSEIAISAGGSAEDIKKALGATSWISTNLSEDVRKQLAEGVTKFQIYARQAGLGDNYAEIAQRFLSGEVTARDLIQSRNPLESLLGTELSRAGGTPDLIPSAERRARVLQAAQTDDKLAALQELAARADWGFTVIQRLNADLFNPQKGVFGVLRQVTLAVGDKTSLLVETRKLIDSIFGKQGLFYTFFQQVGKIFGLEDPLRVVIKGIRWLTRQFNRLTEFLESPMVQGIVSIAEKVVKGVVDFFTDIYSKISGYIQSDEGQESITKVTTFFTNLFTSIEKFFSSDKGKVIQDYANRAVDNVTGLFKAVFDTVSAGDWDPEKIQNTIRQIGTDVRTFIRKIGTEFRDLDIKKQGNFVLEIVGTLIEEITRTIGAVISEGIKTVFSDKGLSVITGLITIVNKALTGFFSEIFGNGPGSILGAVVTGGIVAAFGKKLVAGIVAFGARLIAALPGGAAINTSISRRTSRAISGMTNSISGALGVLGRRIATQLARVPGLGSLVPSAWTRDPSRVTRRGMDSVFEKAVVTYLRAIQRCVCAPGFGGGGGGIDGIDGASQERRRRRVRTGQGPIAPGTVGGIDRRIITPVTQYSSPIGPAIGPNGGRGFPINGPIPPRPVPRLGRGLKKFGKGALIVGGLTALGAGAMGLFGGSDARASQIDPETGEPILTAEQQNKQQQMAGVGNVLSGGLEGALLGATIGSIVPGVGTAAGAVIGGVIGGVVPLLDEGTKKGVTDFVSGLGKSFKDMGDNIAKSLRGFGENISNAAKKGVDWIKEGFNNISGNFSKIDWKTVLINALVPGGNMTIQGLQGIADFASKLNIFDAIKDGIENIKGTIEGMRDNLPGWLGGRREVGGPVGRGLPYLVGERGPEIYIPGRDGMILSNRELTGLRGNNNKENNNISANFNISINVNGGMSTDNIEELRAPIIAIINQAWEQATIGTASRGAIV